MSAGGVLWGLALAGLAGTGPLATPSELILDSVPGFERTSARATDLDFEDFAAVVPGSVGHLDPDSDQAVGMVAATETWSDAATSIVIELVLAIDDVSATTFVDQAAANAIAVGLAATDPPFVGAWSYSGGIDDWTNVVSWNQGPYAVTLTQRSDAETDRTVIDRAAVRQAELIIESTGIEVSDEAAVDEDGPPPPTEAPLPPDVPVTEEGDDRTTIVAIAVVIAAVLAVGLVVSRRRRGATVDG